jgi:hypothetical protein
MTDYEHDSLEVEAPAPFSKFEGRWEQHEENRKAVELHQANGDIRNILPAKKAKLYSKKLTELKKLLADAGVPELLATYEELREEWQDLLAQNYRAERLIETGVEGQRLQEAQSDMAIIKANRAAIRDDYKEAIARLKPFRKWILLERKLNARLDEHEAGLKDEEINRENRELLAKEANTVAEAIIRTMNGLDFCFRTSYKGKERVVSIDFERVVVTPDTLQIKIKTGTRSLFGGWVQHIPRGVSLPKVMKDSSVLEQVSASIEMPVTCPQVESGRWHEGVWILVQRNGLRDGLPKRVLYRDFVKRYPDDMRHKLPIPAGIRPGLWANYVYLTEHPHLIVTGQSGSGKTNMLMSVVCTLITKHSPDEIQFIFVDLKEGVDLHKFATIPHAAAPVVESVEDAAIVMQKLEELRAWRMNELKKAGVRNITQFNQYNTEFQMPHIVIVFDEFGALASAAYKEHSKIVHSYAAQIAMKARAAGIHLFIGVQTPRKEHLPPDIRDNITYKLVGRQGSLGGSLSAVMSKEAADLPKVAGRFICLDGQDSYQIQAAFISDHDGGEIDEAIRQAREYPEPRVFGVDLGMASDDRQLDVIQAAAVQKAFGPDEFIEIVVNELGGTLNYREVFESVKDRDYSLTLRQSKKIADQIKQAQMIEYDGDCYELVPYGRGFRLELTDIITESHQEHSVLE